MAGETEPDEQRTPGPRRYARLREWVGQACLAAPVCLAVTLIWRAAAVLLIPGLDWSLWAATLAGVTAAALFVLLFPRFRFDEDEIAERLETALVVVLNIGFVALAAGVLRLLGEPIWVAIPLGAVAVALAYIVMSVGTGESLEYTMLIFAILSVIASLMFPIMLATRHKARLAAEQRHRSILRTPAPLTPRDSGVATAPGRN